MDSRVELSRIRKSDSLLTQHVGSETLLYNEQTHQAFCLNPIASEVWRLLDDMENVSQLAAAATLRLQMPVNDELVLFALTELRRDGLIEVKESAPAIPVMDRRDLLQKLGAGAVMMLPVVAAIMAPKAAQAYNGCVDCTVEDKQAQEAEEASGLSKKTPQQGPLSMQQTNSRTHGGQNDFHPLFVP